jgi:GDP-mannose 6-dehydrogenase
MLDMVSDARPASVSLDSHTIAVFGLGYVGTVSAACLAKSGHTVIGVDPQQSKIDLINDRMPPVIEAGLAELIQETAQEKRLRATSDAVEAVALSTISLVCVGTPGRPNGSLDLGSIARVCEEIGAALGRSDQFHVVVIRSTILPGTMSELIRPTLERTSGKKAGIDFGLANNPEFLREGTAIKDFYDPPKIVIGAFDERSREIVAGLYRDIDAPLIQTSVEIAEMIKYADNSWHALKVAFGNEIGNICKALGIDGHRLMDVFCKDTKLNISPSYLYPGFAFGGSCLPKDLRALTYHARHIDLSLPVLESILPSNRLQIERAMRVVASHGRRRIGVLGFSFKAGTDDLRESPMVELIESLIGKGYDVCLYDRNIHLSQLVGANREHILNAIPHIAKLMVDTVDEVIAHGELILIGTADGGYQGLRSQLAPYKVVIDMAGFGRRRESSERYDGINW